MLQVHDRGNGLTSHLKNPLKDPGGREEVISRITRPIERAGCSKHRYHQQKNASFLYYVRCCYLPYPGYKLLNPFHY